MATDPSNAAQGAHQQPRKRRHVTRPEPTEHAAKQQPGEHKSVERIYEHARAVVRKQLRVGIQEEEEEVQEALARLLTCTARHGKRLLELPEEDLRKMLKVIVRCRATDLWRTGPRRKARQLPQELPEAGLTPEEAVGRAELLSLLERAVDALPQTMRIVIVARFLNGRTYKQIAADLGISKNYCYQLCHRALLQLRHALQDFL